MIDKRLANQYVDLIQVTRALKPHATNMLLVNDEGYIILQSSMRGILNWAKIRTDEVDITPFTHTYFNIPQATSVNTKFRKTKSNIDWVEHDDQTFLKVSNADGTEMEQPIIRDSTTREDFFKKTYARVFNNNKCGKYHPLLDIPDREFETIPIQVCESMANKNICAITVSGHVIYISRPLLGDTKKTEWLGARVLYESQQDIDQSTAHDRRAVIYFKQREPLIEVYTYGAFLILENDD